MDNVISRFYFNSFLWSDRNQVVEKQRKQIHNSWPTEKTNDFHIKIT